jgi:hypothetical protein
MALLDVDLPVAPRNKNAPAQTHGAAAFTNELKLLHTPAQVD